MEAKKLLTIALTGLLAGGCLMVPALAEAEQRESGDIHDSGEGEAD